MKAKTVDESRTRTAHVMTPNEANLLGKVFGGALLSYIDLAAYATASRFAETTCVTAAFDRVDFHEPIDVGELVTLDAYVSYVGKTSVEVTIDVFAEDVRGGEMRKTNTARVTMVALKGDRPSPVPRLICQSRNERLRFLEGCLRRGMRGVQRAELRERLERFEQMNDADLAALFATDGGLKVDPLNVST